MEEQENIELIKKHHRNEYIYVCTWCSKSFSKQSNLSRHTKNIHGSSVAERKKLICCPLCKTLFGLYTELDTHLYSEHSISVIMKKHTVLNTKDFQNWKTQVEAETKSCFRFLNSIMKESKKITKYVCHRSGNCNIKEKNRQRAIKVKGSNKINAHCPARIIATETLGQVVIQYFETHIGHTQDVGSLRLLKSERERIAAKLFQGISHQRILKDIGDKFDPSKRLSYTTNHDIHNIKNLLNKQAQNNSNDLETKKISVIEEMSSLITNISECQSYEALLYVSKNLQSIKSGMHAIECHNLDSIVPETKYSHTKK